MRPLRNRTRISACSVSGDDAMDDKATKPKRLPPEDSGRAPAIREFGPQFIALVLACSIVLTGVLAVKMGDWIRNEPLEPILIATGEWPPYSGVALPQYGIASAIVASALQRLGYAPDFRFMPWTRTEQSALSNDSSRGIRAAFPYAREPVRDAQFYYSQPVLEIELSIFYNASRNPAAKNIIELTDLAGFQVVPISGYRYAGGLQEFVGKMPPADDVESALRRVIDSDRPLLVAEAAAVADGVLTGPLARQAHRIAIAPLRIKSPIHLIASKRNPNNYSLVRDFDRALAAMRADGSLDQIAADVSRSLTDARTVNIEPIVPGALIEAFDGMDSATRVLLPRGTRAVVEGWSRAYTEPSSTTYDTPQRIRIRILNGPQDGQVLYVDERSITVR